MSDLKAAIENLYTAFSQYTTLGIHHCDCGCIDEEDVKKLHSKPLRALGPDDLSSYHGSALYTWGDLEHYKHFLPRFFELYSAKKDYSIIDLYDIGRKLEYARWAEWPENEVTAIRNFLLADWIDFTNNSYTEISEDDLENYCRFFDIELLVQMWNITQSETALRKFVLFFYRHGNQILAKGLKLGKKQSNTELKKLIYTNNLTEKLQDAFFEFETKDTEYAGKVSIVLQMIEQQFKFDGLNGK